MYIIEPNENVQEGAYIVGELDDSNLRSGECNPDSALCQRRRNEG